MRLIFLIFILVLSITPSFVTFGSLCWGAPFEAVPFVGLGGVSEGGRAPTLDEKIGARFSGPLLRSLSVEGGVAFSRYRMTYFAIPLSATQEGEATINASRFSVPEKRFDYFGALSHPIWEGGVRIDLKGGYRGILLENEFSSFHFGGPLLGLAGEATYPWGTLSFGGGISLNLLRRVENHVSGFLTISGSESLSLFGDPIFAAEYSLWGWKPWREGLKIGLGYEGETLFFQHLKRLTHTLSLAVAF